MRYTTLDFAQDQDPDVAAAQVALFVLQSCLRVDLCSSTSLFDYMFSSDTTTLNRTKLVARLAALSKPAWLDGRLDGQQCRIEAGPIADNPKLKARYERWHGLVDDKRSSPFAVPPTTHSKPDVLCVIESTAIRVHLRDFQRFHRDYYLPRPVSYGITPTTGLFRLFIPLSLEESAGLSHLVQIRDPGRFHGIFNQS